MWEIGIAYESKEGRCLLCCKAGARECLSGGMGRAFTEGLDIAEKAGSWCKKPTFTSTAATAPSFLALNRYSIRPTKKSGVSSLIVTVGRCRFLESDSPLIGKAVCLTPAGMLKKKL